MCGKFAAPVLQEPGQGGQEEEEDNVALGVSSCVWSVTGTRSPAPLGPVAFPSYKLSRLAWPGGTIYSPIHMVCSIQSLVPVCLSVCDGITRNKVIQSYIKVDPFVSGWMDDCIDGYAGCMEDRIEAVDRYINMDGRVRTEWTEWWTDRHADKLLFLVIKYDAPFVAFSSRRSMLFSAGRGETQ